MQRIIKYWFCLITLLRLLSNPDGDIAKFLIEQRRAEPEWKVIPPTQTYPCGFGGMGEHLVPYKRTLLHHTPFYRFGCRQKPICFSFDTCERQAVFYALFCPYCSLQGGQPKRAAFALALCR